MPVSGDWSHGLNSLVAEGQAYRLGFHTELKKLKEEPERKIRVKRSKTGYDVITKIHDKDVVLINTDDRGTALKISKSLNWEINRSMWNEVTWGSRRGCTISIPFLRRLE